ncbi:RNA 2',3'-cyclic phosphodiesterase [Halomonas sp. WWR20]
MRLFFALWPDDALRERLHALAQTAQRTCGGRATRPQALHLTLAFLGEVADSEAESLVALTQSLQIAPGRWILDRFGGFARGGVLWAGSREPSPALATLHGQLQQALAEHGWAIRERAFLPHVTLLRHARISHLECLGAPHMAWEYTRLELIHSIPEGPQHRYRTLARSA